MASLRATFAHDQNGATAIEYAILAALIGIGLIGTLGLFGDEMVNQFTRVGDEMPVSAPPPRPPAP